MRVLIETLDERPIASTFFMPREYHHRWNWIVDSVAEYFGCEPDAIHENDDDQITIDGKPVAIARRDYGWRAL